MKRCTTTPAARSRPLRAKPNPWALGTRPREASCGDERQGSSGPQRVESGSRSGPSWTFWTVPDGKGTTARRPGISVFAPRFAADTGTVNVDTSRLGRLSRPYHLDVAGYSGRQGARPFGSPHEFFRWRSGLRRAVDPPWRQRPGHNSRALHHRPYPGLLFTAENSRKALWGLGRHNFVHKGNLRSISPIPVRIGRVSMSHLLLQSLHVDRARELCRMVNSLKVIATGRGKYRSPCGYRLSAKNLRVSVLLAPLKMRPQ